jgi:hypothetical protein
MLMYYGHGLAYYFHNHGIVAEDGLVALKLVCLFLSTPVKERPANTVRLGSVAFRVFDRHDRRDSPSCETSFLRPLVSPNHPGAFLLFATRVPPSCGLQPSQMTGKLFPVGLGVGQD